MERGMVKLTHKNSIKTTTATTGTSSRKIPTEAEVEVEAVEIEEIMIVTATTEITTEEAIEATSEEIVEEVIIEEIAVEEITVVVAEATSTVEEAAIIKTEL
jgi:hypothetical protein